MSDYRFTMATDGKAGEWVYVGSDTGKLRRCVQTSDPHRVKHYVLGQDVIEGDKLILNVNTGLLFTEEESRKQAAAAYLIPKKFIVGAVPPEGRPGRWIDPKAMLLTTQPEEDQPMTTTTFDPGEGEFGAHAPMSIYFDAEAIHQFAAHLFLHADILTPSLVFEERVKTSLEWAADRQDHLRLAGDGDITYRYDRDTKQETDADYPTVFPAGTPVYTRDGKVFGHLGEPLSIHEDETSEDYGTVTQEFVVGEKWDAAVSDVVTTEPQTEVTEVWCRADNSTLSDRGFSYNPDDPADVEWAGFARDLLLEVGYRRVWPQGD